MSYFSWLIYQTRDKQAPEFSQTSDLHDEKFDQSCDVKVDAQQRQNKACDLVFFWSFVHVLISIFPSSKSECHTHKHTSSIVFLILTGLQKALAQSWRLNTVCFDPELNRGLLRCHFTECRDNHSPHYALLYVWDIIQVVFQQNITCVNTVLGHYWMQCVIRELVAFKNR